MENKSYIFFMIVTWEMERSYNETQANTVSK